MSNEPSPVDALTAKLAAAQGELCRTYWASLLVDAKTARGDYAAIGVREVTADVRALLVGALVRGV